MGRVCAKCGYEAQDGDTFILFIDPKSEWWLSLIDGPAYCEKCADEIRKENYGKSRRRAKKRVG